MRRTAVLVTGLLVLVLAAGCSDDSDKDEPDEPTSAAAGVDPDLLVDASDSCTAPTGSLTLAPDGASMYVTTPSPEVATDVRELVDCLLAAMDAPDGMSAALDRPENDQVTTGWPGVGFTFTKDPSAGLSVQFVLLST